MNVAKPDESLLGIAAVERDTGVSKDTLRVWERRYGFPAPVRDDNGDRLYPMSQVERLRLIRRLLDMGCRPAWSRRVPKHRCPGRTRILAASSNRFACTAAWSCAPACSKC